MVTENSFIPNRDNLDSKSNNRETGLEKSIKNYEKGAEKLATIVQEISHLSVPEKTINDWKIIFVSMRVVDHKLDHIVDPKLRSEFTQKITSFLKGKEISFLDDEELERTMLEIRKLSMTLPEDPRQFFISSILRILKITEEIKVEKDPENLVNLTRLEGQINARFFLPFLPEKFRQSENYPKIVHAITRLSRAANSFDTFIDLPSDYKNKQVQVQPTVFNRFLFLSALLSDGLEAIKDVKISTDLIKSIVTSIKATGQNNSES
jgi:hypothetical protein